MTDFTDLNLITDNLVSYWTGNYTILALFIIVIFMLIIMSRDVDFRYAVVFVLPLAGLFLAIGWFNTVPNNEWIINTFLIVVSMIYGFAFLRLTT